MDDSTLKNAKILIVDDKESNIDILTELLNDTGYSQVRSTTDSRLVLNLFHAFQPDLILLDLMMPYMDGFEVMDQLGRELPTHSYLPILVLTADITKETKLRALRSGARDFLSKPFDLYEVRLRINNLLETRYLYQQLENQNKVLEEKVKERTLDLEQANLLLGKANNELAHLDKAKNDFMHLISHELRTPLNGILGFTGILKEQIDSPELLEYLHYLDDSAKRLEKFSYQALLITELQSGKYNLFPENVSLDVLLQETIQSLQDTITTKNLSIVIQRETFIDGLWGDNELISNCFLRLLDNSVKYSPNNGEVLIKVFADQQSTICEFRDCGDGYSKNIIENIFLPFGNSDKHVDQNTGLNLPLIKLIMDAHTGKFDVFNNPEKGATAKLTFTNQRF